MRILPKPVHMPSSTHSAAKQYLVGVNSFILTVEHGEGQPQVQPRGCQVVRHVYCHTILGDRCVDFSTILQFWSRRKYQTNRSWNNAWLTGTVCFDAHAAWATRYIESGVLYVRCGETCRNKSALDRPHQATKPECCVDKVGATLRAIKTCKPRNMSCLRRVCGVAIVSHGTQRRDIAPGTPDGLVLERVPKSPRTQHHRNPLS